jgi:hypothetical protein
MCSASLPIDVLITRTHDDNVAADTLIDHAHRFCGALERLDVLGFYDLVVLSTVAKDDAAATSRLVSAGREGQLPSLGASADLAAFRHSVPIGDLLLVIASTEEAAYDVQARAIEIARLRGGCRDLILRLRTHRDAEIAPLEDSLVHHQLGSDIARTGRDLAELVAERQRLFLLDRTLAEIDHDWECLCEYAADFESRLTMTTTTQTVLQGLYAELRGDDLEPLRLMLAQARARHTAAASYLRAEIDLAFAQANLQMSRTIRLLQGVQVLLAVAVLALGAVQLVQVLQGP